MKVKVEGRCRKQNVDVIFRRPTIRAFYWSVLRENSKMRPLIQRYFGELGEHLCTHLCAIKHSPYFQEWHNSAWLPTPGFEDSYDFVERVNAIPYFELLSNDKPIDKQEATKRGGYIKEYIESRPYRFILNNEKEIILISQFINLSLRKHKHILLYDSDLWLIFDYLVYYNRLFTTQSDCLDFYIKCHKRSFAAKLGCFRSYTQHAHAYLKSLYKGIGEESFERALKRLFDTNQFSSGGEKLFLQNRKCWRRLASKIDTEYQKILDSLDVPLNPI